MHQVSVAVACGLSGIWHLTPAYSALRFRHGIPELQFALETDVIPTGHSRESRCTRLRDTTHPCVSLSRPVCGLCMLSSLCSTHPLTPMLALILLAAPVTTAEILLLGADEHDIMLSPQVMNFLNSIGVEVQISDVVCYWLPLRVIAWPLRSRSCLALSACHIVYSCSHIQRINTGRSTRGRRADRHRQAAATASAAPPRSLEGCEALLRTEPALCTRRDIFVSELEEPFECSATGCDQWRGSNQC